MTTAPDASDPTPQPAAEPAIARAEDRLRALKRVTMKSLAAMDAVKEDGSPDSADSIAKLARAVRLTVILEEKLDNALSARLAGQSPKAEKPRAAKDDDPESEDVFAELKTGRKGRVRDLLVDVIDHESPDPCERDDIVDALEERLLCDAAYDTLEDLPLRDIVERLCADLRLKPDWKRWTGDGWAPNPPFWRPRCSQFASPSRIRILGAAPEPDRRE